MEEQKLRAKRDALHAEVARGAEGGKERRSNSEGFYIVSCGANIWAGSLTRHVGTFFVSSELASTKTLKFNNVEPHFGMWRSTFQAFLSSSGCLYVLKATDNPVMVGDINVSQEELEQRHTPKRLLMRVGCMDC